MSRPSASSRGDGSSSSASTRPSGPAYRSAPDAHSYQKNQKFHVSDGASASASLVSSVPLLKPVFARDVVVAAPASTRVATAVAPVVVQSSRNMKASAPLSRAPVQVVDAGSVSEQRWRDQTATAEPHCDQFAATPPQQRSSLVDCAYVIAVIEYARRC
jgi:hypothetical protein